MPSPSRHAPWRTVLVCSMAMLVVMLSAGSAFAASTPSPSPSSDPTSASPTANPSPAVSPSASQDTDAALGGVDDQGAAVQTGTGEDLAVGIDRWIAYNTTATAIGGNGVATASLPMPVGLLPIRVRGRLVSIADSDGIVRVRIGENYVEMDAATGGLFSLTVPVGAVRDNNLTIEVRNTLVPPPGECVGDSTTSETLEDLEVGFLVVETPPNTIAGFFSPPVRKVSLVYPDSSDIAVAEATLATAGALATRYGSSVPLVPVTQSTFDADPENLVDSDGPNRIVRLSPSDADVISVDISNPGVPTLTLSGPTDKLADAGAALASLGLGLAAVPTATELSEQRSSIVAQSLTLEQLGAEKPTLSGLGRLNYSVPVNQDRFGGPIAAFSIHLEGAHTPVPPGGSAVASILWNDQLVQSLALTDDDQYAADVTVEGPLVRRDNTLTIRIDSSAPGGQCSTNTQPLSQQPMQLDVNGFKSTITASAGQTLASGFTRFPQAFASSLHVAFGSGALTPDIIESTCSLVVSLQRAAARQLDITAEAFDSFMKANYPGLVVGATPDDANALEAPLRFEPWRTLNSESSDFEVTVDGPFAALEAFETDGRNLLMLGSTAPADQAAPLVAQIADEVENGEFGWFGLLDNLVVAQPDSEVTFLNSSSVIPQVTPLTEGRKLLPWSIILIILIVVVILVRWWLAHRRKKGIDKQIADVQAPTDVESTEQPPELS